MNEEELADQQREESDPYRRCQETEYELDRAWRELVDARRELDERTKERDEARRERDELRTALTWMCIGDTGAVAEALVWAALGHDSKWAPDIPLNIYKREQCVRALRIMPWLLPTLEKLEAQSEQWREQGKLIRAELNGEAKP